MIRKIDFFLLQELVERAPEYSGGKKELFSDEVRKQIILRDEGVCRLCGDPGYCAHHIVPRGGGSLENGIFLCESCHSLVHHFLSATKGYPFVNPKLIPAGPLFNDMCNSVLDQYIDITIRLENVNERLDRVVDYAENKVQTMKNKKKWLEMENAGLKNALKKIPVRIRKEFDANVRIK